MMPENHLKTLTEKHIDYQLITPGIHRKNALERAISTWNNYFVSVISGTDKLLPMYLWYRLLEKAYIMLIMIRPS